MLALLAMVAVVCVWLNPHAGLFTKMFLTLFICSGGCGLGACLGIYDAIQ